MILSLRVRALLLVMIVLGYASLALLLPRPPTLVVLTGQSEQVSFKVTVPEMVRFRLRGLALRTDSAGQSQPADKAKGSAAAYQPSPAQCLDGMLETRQGTKVTYRRTEGKPLRILLQTSDGSPAARLYGQSRAVSPDIAKQDWLLLEASDKCEGAAPRRLPISGIAEIGDELRPETSADEPASAPLLSASLSVFGRAVDKALLNGRFGDDIYPVTEMDLPSGSRIVEAGLSPSSPWVGFIRVEDDTDGFEFSATTELNALALYRPGGGLDPEIISIGMFAQLTNDPNVIMLQVALAVLFTLVQFVGSFGGRRRKDP